MDCPSGGDAAVQYPDSRVEGVLSEQAGAGIANFELDGDTWRREVASRLERYRARRKPRAPRYPSLRLPFDSADSWLPVSGSALAMSSRTTVPEPTPENQVEQDSPHLVEPRVAVSLEPEPLVPEPYTPEPLTNVIEFPRSAAVPVYHANQLAEPVFERPRIVEAPEVLPPPPALGGMLMEAARAREPERKAGVDLAVTAAPLRRRLLAGFFDALVLAGAQVAFGAMFVWLNPQRPPVAVLALAAVIVAVLLWAGYEFLFTVYTGSTPGLRLARLRLVKFDGSPAPRSSRRWRVLAAYLSAFSLGLGYLWSILDEDGLCWHDRITHTHIS